MAGAACHGTQPSPGKGSHSPAGTSPAGRMLPAVVPLPAACPGRPWRGRIPSPTLRLAQAARQALGGQEVLGGHPPLSVAPGSAWVNPSVALFISELQEKRLMVT